MKKTAFRSIGVALWLIALLVATGVHAAPVMLPGSAAAGPVIRFSPSSSTVDPGATFAIDVVVDNAADLGAFQFTVSFNPAVVQVQNVTLGSFLGSTGRTATPLGPNIDNVGGSFTFGGFTFGVAGGPSGTGTVAQITLQAVGSGSTTSLTFADAQLTNTAADLLLPLTTTPGSVTVSGPTPTSTLQRGRIYLPVLRRRVP
jgi:hypothetical protein